jgi:hypothetical protein
MLQCAPTKHNSKKECLKNKNKVKKYFFQEKKETIVLVCLIN